MNTQTKEFIQDINNSIVLEAITKTPSISRMDLMKKLRITKTTFSTIIQELLKKKLILEVGDTNIHLSHKNLMLEFNQDAGYALCIDIGVSSCTALLTNLRGETYKTEKITTPKDLSKLDYALIKLIEHMQLYLPTTPYGLVGITLGIHGVTHDNRVIFAPYYKLSEYDLAKTIGGHFDVPVYLENEANLSALGESTFAYDYPNIASISIHSGVGLGLIMNNRIYTGFSGYAGEFGHTIIAVDGRPCPCGNHGCLEQYVSEQVLLNEFAAMKRLPFISFDQFASYYRSRDSDAQIIVNKFVKYMTVGLNNMLNAYNPELVVINSSFTTYFPELAKVIENCLSSKMNDYLYVVPSTLQDTSSLLGGISLVIEQFLGIKNLKLQKAEKPKGPTA